MKETININFNNMLKSSIGEHGLSYEQIECVAADTKKVHTALEEKRNSTTWRDLPFNQKEIMVDINETAKYIRSNFENFVVFGIGGSSLGSKALFSALCHLHYNELSPEKRKGPKFYVVDNVDPDKMNALFDVIDISKTAFHVISKSGNTVETLSQFTIVLSRLKEVLGDEYNKNIFITTDKEKGNMKRIATENSFKTFTVPDGVGGRFSIFSPVGMLSAAVLGIDTESLLKGAGDMDALTRSEDITKNPSFMYASLYVAAMKKGVNISVLMPYAEGMLYTAEWYAQLWAESLGKKVDNNGKIVYAGQTPVRALGVTDQHSQIQLYSEGPFDKVVTFVKVMNTKTTMEIPHCDIDMYDAKYLQGQTVNKLILSELDATEYALTKAGKMNNTITINKLDAYTFGALLSFFEVATAAAGEYLNINAFNQPGVEEGKVATFALMGREGYDQKRKELTIPTEKDEKYIYRF